MPSPSVIIIVADGARPDTLGAAIDRGGLPALAQLRAEGGAHTVTSVFPSVTGPAYVPFLMGRFPGPVGLPGLRWYDRSRRTASAPHYTRSYVGAEMRHVDRDLAVEAPTLFELAAARGGASVAALNMIGRGLPKSGQMARSARFAIRAARTYFSGDVAGWLAIDEDIAGQVAERVARERPMVTFAALTGIDKTSHSLGHGAEQIDDALGIVDRLIGRLRGDAERDGRWASTTLMVVSDHGHSPVDQHEDLDGVVRDLGHRTVAHPWVYSLRAPDVAVMVSGNAMAHLYLEPAQRAAPGWPALAARWGSLRDALMARPSVDLALFPSGAGRCHVAGRGRGEADVEHDAERGLYAYRPHGGDPLSLGGPVEWCDEREAYARCAPTDYPDALVQIAHLASSTRAGDIILSAARGWDFRARYEPIPHRSSHGALHREHMLVPLLLNRRPAGAPRRTTDVMPTALHSLGIAVPEGLDGESCF